MPDTEPNRVRSISERVYEALLVAYPKEFRSKYGPQMAQVFRDLCREERRGKAFRIAELWVRTLLDLATTAFVERSSVFAFDSSQWHYA